MPPSMEHHEVTLCVSLQVPCGEVSRQAMPHLFPLIDQLCGIDNHWLVDGLLTQLSPSQLQKVDQALSEILDLR